MHWFGFDFLLVASAAENGLLAGASLDQSVKQLPARHTIGHVAYSKYSRAADLASGVLLYSALGGGAALLAVAAAWAARTVGLPSDVRLPLYAGAAVAKMHSVCTTQAAPTLFRQQRVSGNETALKDVFDRFQRWQNARCALQLIGFGISLWSLWVYVH